LVTSFSIFLLPNLFKSPFIDLFGDKMDLPYTEQRPWGSFTQYSDNEQTTVKLLDVKPGIRLSYQYHDHRDEE